MNCDEALLAISAALDGEISPRERAALSEHLLACAGCRELAADLRVLTEELERSDREPPEELAAAIRKAVAEEAKAPAPKKRRAPYLRTVAVLALCVCLGGAGLFAAGRMGMKGAAGGVAPANYQAAPESMEKSNRAAQEDCYDGAMEGDSAPAGGEPDAPMASAVPMDPADAPLPMPSVAPSADSIANGGTDSDGLEETAPGMVGADSGSGEEKSSLTPEEALELVFVYIGGYEVYPEAVRYTAVVDGAQMIGYSLQTVETETVRSEYCLHYVGLSSDGGSCQFHLYEDITDKADGSGHTATMNWIDVSVDSGQITPMF